jgi:hypothetical protein
MLSYIKAKLVAYWLNGLTNVWLCMTGDIKYSLLTSKSGMNYLKIESKIVLENKIYAGTSLQINRLTYAIHTSTMSIHAQAPTT